MLDGNAEGAGVTVALGKPFMPDELHHSLAEILAHPSQGGQPQP